MEDTPYPRRHDMGELLALARRRFPALGHMEEAIMLLAPFAVAARYDESVAPDEEDAQEALVTARGVREFAERALRDRGRDD
jgi:HEPN domain-containing protein